MINTAQASKRWRITQRKIRECCSKGFVEGAKKNPKTKRWEIPDNAMRPFIFTPRLAKEQSGRKALILQAISREETIPNKKLTSFKGRVDALFNELIAQELIKHDPTANGTDKYHTHMLTEKGELLLSNNTKFNKIVTELNKLPQVQLHLHLPQVPG